jgi:hypothetical protein
MGIVSSTIPNRRLIKGTDINEILEGRKGKSLSYLESQSLFYRYNYLLRHPSKRVILKVKLVANIKVFKKIGYFEGIFPLFLLFTFKR